MSRHLAGIDAFFDRFATLWKTNDGGELASAFAAESSLISPFGERSNGRSAISDMYVRYFDGLLHGTTTTIQVQTVRPVETNHAFVDCEQTIVGPDGDVVLVAHVVSLLRKAGNDWSFVESRPYEFPPRPE